MQRKLLLASGIVLFAGLPLLFFLLGSSKTPAPYSSPLIEMTPIPEIATLQKSGAPYQTVATDVKDLHWLNTNELGYTFYDNTINRRVLAEVVGKKTITLLANPNIKMSEVFWSKKNDLFIFDYGAPHNIYLLHPPKDLAQLQIKGYAFNWSPSGEELFYRDDDTTNHASIYEVSTGNSKILPGVVPEFAASYWLNPTTVLLYNIDEETGIAALTKLSLTDNTIEPLQLKNALFPSFSPDFNTLAYATSTGVSTYRFTDKVSSSIYQPESSQTQYSFNWIDSDKLLIYDGVKNQFYLFANGQTKPVSLGIALDNNQRVQIAVSPDKKQIAIGTEKNGLWIVKNAL